MKNDACQRTSYLLTMNCLPSTVAFESSPQTRLRLAWAPISAEKELKRSLPVQQDSHFRFRRRTWSRTRPCAAAQSRFRRRCLPTLAQVLLWRFRTTPSTLSRWERSSAEVWTETFSFELSSSCSTMTTEVGQSLSERVACWQLFLREDCLFFLLRWRLLFLRASSWTFCSLFSFSSCFRFLFWTRWLEALETEILRCPCRRSDVADWARRTFESPLSVEAPLCRSVCRWPAWRRLAPKMSAWKRWKHKAGLHERCTR